MCFAEFLRWYYLKRDLVSNDNLPVELTDPDIENNHFPSINHPKVIPLMSSKDKQQCRKVSFVLRYHVPSKKYPEKYSYHLLHLFYPFRDEMELKGKYLETYKVWGLTILMVTQFILDWVLIVRDIFFH